jgi:hypothetical protein
MFPKGCPLSIFGAGELNYRVRDGNGCGLSARVTRIFDSVDAIGRSFFDLCGMTTWSGSPDLAATGR